MSYLEDKISFQSKIDELNTHIKNNPTNAELFNTLAIVYEKIGDFEKAIEFYKGAIQRDVNYVKAYNNIGVILYKQADYLKAVEIFKLSLEVDDKFVSTYVNLGAACNKAKMYEEGEKALLKAIELDDENSGAYANLGNIYNKIKRHDEARIQHEMALHLDDKSASNHANIGITFKNLGLFKEAKNSLEKAIELDPNFANAHFDLATTYLALNDYENGFREYEWRFKKSEMKSLSVDLKDVFKMPKFTLDCDTAGKTLLLFTEQGFGDILQFSRFVTVIKERYPKLTIKIEVRAELKTLFECMAGFDEVVARGDDRGEFDYQLALMSLPHVLNLSYSDITNKPYLKALGKSDLKVDRQKLNVGVVWGASSSGESYEDKVFSLNYFRPLMEDKEIQLYSLQVAGDSKEIKELNLSSDEIIDLEDSLIDFKETSLVIEKLDLVITSDTSVAHLAGAMGKEAWVVLQKNADWRWGVSGEDSFWYSSLKLFRQDRQGDWKSAFEKVYKMIEEKK